MLKYKAWLDTRWRFLIGLGLLAVLAAGTVFEYRVVEPLLPATARAMDAAGDVNPLIRRAFEVQREYRGFVWWQAFRQNLSQLGTLFAVLLGSGGLLSQGSGASALFTLSLPVSRRHLVSARAAMGLGELLALAVVPAVLIPVLSPLAGQHYSFASAIVHGVSLFAAASVFFSLALLFSTAFDDVWRPLVMACGVAVMLAVLEQAVPAFWRFGIFRTMSGEIYFSAGQLPWVGWLASAALTAALLYASAANLERRDF
jgi:ABC-2 type transport system permease protein